MNFSDKKLASTSSAAEIRVLSRLESAQELSYSKCLLEQESVKRELALQRLLGDEFLVYVMSIPYLFVVEKGGQCFLFELVTDEAKQYWTTGSPEYFFSAHDLAAVKPCNSLGGPLSALNSNSNSGEGILSFVEISLQNGTRLSCQCANAPSSMEMLEVLGGILRWHNNARARTVKNLHYFQAESQTSFSWANHLHVELLQSFYRHAVPRKGGMSVPPSEILAPCRPAPEWKKLGFQSDDPLRDFRGMGILSLRAMAYLSSRFPSNVQRILVANRDYPFAVACMHVLQMMMADFLAVSEALMREAHWSEKWSSPLFLLLTQLDSDDAFYLVFSEFVLLLDEIFVSRKGSYMTFTPCMEELQDVCTAVLEKKPPTLSVFTRSMRHERNRCRKIATGGC